MSKFTLRMLYMVPVLALVLGACAPAPTHGVPVGLRFPQKHPRSADRGSTALSPRPLAGPQPAQLGGSMPASAYVPAVEFTMAGAGDVLAQCCPDAF
jgi:hypothetical protein